MSTLGTIFPGVGTIIPPANAYTYTLAGSISTPLGIIASKTWAAQLISPLMSSFGTVVPGVGTMIPPFISCIQSFSATPLGFVGTGLSILVGGLMGMLMF